MIPSAADFYGQPLAVALLDACLRRDRTSGTFLILGQRGLGKTTLATVLARAIVCERNDPPRLQFCGECYACRTIASGNQPEFVLISPMGKEIKKEQLYGEAGAMHTAALHPIHLSHRVFVIDDAHYLNEETGNQLLKLLEEAPERTVFILTSDKPELLLPTIHSRGRRIVLSPEPASRMELLVHERMPEAKAHARRAAVMGAGRFVDTLALAGNRHWCADLGRLAEELHRRGKIAEAAKTAAAHEFEVLWEKQQEAAASDPDGEKAIAAARKNELQRQALLSSYDRASLWLLSQHAPPEGLAQALGKLKARVNQNVDQAVSQAAFELAISQ